MSDGETGGKKCTICNKFKPLDEFYRNAKSPDGFAYYCKECVQNRYQAQCAQNEAHAVEVRASMTSKVCIWCKVSKPLTEFGSDRANIDGLNTRCKECLSAYGKARYANDCERIKAVHKAWREKWPDKIRESHCQEYERLKSDAERYARKLSYGTDYYARNRDEVLARRKTQPAVREASKAYQDRKMANDPVWHAAHLMGTRLVAAYRKWLQTGQYPDGGGETHRKAKPLYYKAIFEHMGPCPGVWGRGSGENIWQIDHIVPMRAFRLDTSDLAWRICSDPRNHRWATGRENWEKGYELTESGYGLLCEIYRDITGGREFDAVAAKEILVSSEKELDETDSVE